MLWRGFAIGRGAELDRRYFQAYLCYGLTGWLGMQALINMGVTIRLFPAKGMTLPLISLPAQEEQEPARHETGRSMS